MMAALKASSELCKNTITQAAQEVAAEENRNRSGFSDTCFILTYADSLVVKRCWVLCAGLCYRSGFFLHETGAKGWGQVQTWQASSQSVCAFMKGRGRWWRGFPLDEEPSSVPCDGSSPRITCTAVALHFPFIRRMNIRQKEWVKGGWKGMGREVAA